MRPKYLYRLGQVVFKEGLFDPSNPRLLALLLGVMLIFALKWLSEQRVLLKALLPDA